jgi:hypothetical protein
MKTKKKANRIEEEEEEEEMKTNKRDQFNGRIIQNNRGCDLGGAVSYL